MNPHTPRAFHSLPLAILLAGLLLLSGQIALGHDCDHGHDGNGHHCLICQYAQTPVALPGLVTLHFAELVVERGAPTAFRTVEEISCPAARPRAPPTP